MNNYVGYFNFKNFSKHINKKIWWKKQFLNVCEIHWIFLALLAIYFVQLINSFNYFLLLFLIPLICFIVFFKLYKSILLLLILIIACVMAFVSYYSTISYKINYLSLIFNKVFDLHKFLINWVYKKYPKNLADFITLLLFANRNLANASFEQIKSLGIFHLTVVSQLHMFLIYKILIFPFNKFKIWKYFVLAFLFVYWWSLNFSYSTQRVIINLIFFHKALKDNKRRLEVWAKITFISWFLNFKMFLSYSFILSYGIVFLIYLSLRIKFKSWILKSFAFYFLTYFFSSLIVLNFTRKIYYFAYLNTSFVMFLILFLFVYFFFTFFIFWLQNLHYFFYNLNDKVLKILNLNKSYLFVYWKTEYSYYGFLFLVLLILSFLIFQRIKLK